MLGLAGAWQEARVFPPFPAPSGVAAVHLPARLASPLPDGRLGLVRGPSFELALQQLYNRLIRQERSGSAAVAAAAETGGGGGAASMASSGTSTSGRYYSSRCTLPSGWETRVAGTRNQNALALVKVDGLKIKYVGPGEDDNQAVTVRANYPLPLDCPLYYFEVLVLDRGAEGFIGIGFQTEEVTLNRLPGWDPHSFGYHGARGGGGGEARRFARMACMLENALDAHAGVQVWGDVHVLACMSGTWD